LRRRRVRHADPHTCCVPLAEAADMNHRRHSVQRFRHLLGRFIAARSRAFAPAAKFSRRWRRVDHDVAAEPTGVAAGSGSLSRRGVDHVRAPLKRRCPYLRATPCTVARRPQTSATSGTKEVSG
jgi:hypothetical protein